MTTSDRKKIVSEMLERDGIVYLSKLTEFFPEVSMMTLRRDLDELERNGIAVRIYGGAQKKSAGSEPFYGLRANKNKSAKEIIARIAVKYVKENQSVFIDCGTTAMEMAKIMPCIPLSVTTCGPNIAMEIARHSNANIMVLGGQLNRENLSISGKQTEEMLSNINIDTAFIVASGFTLNSGFSCGNYNEYTLKKLALNKAQRKIMLLDDSKFNRNLMFSFATEEDIDVLITSQKPPQDILDRFKELNKQIIYN